MTPPTDEERALRSAVIAWNSFRIAAKALRAQRAQFFCERTEKVEVCDWAPVFERGRPCWKTFIDDPEDTHWSPEEPPNQIRLPEDRWCSSCKSREVVHRGYRDACRNRGVEMRRMQHYAAKVKP